ncbi:MAG: alpha/beta hydrolase [Cyanobacteria bacterium J06623_4]
MGSVHFLSPQPSKIDKPLFVFLPGMDGTGTLFRSQIERLAPWFDIRCLSLPPTDKTEWQPLTRQVTQLIRQEVAERTSTERAFTKRAQKEKELPTDNPQPAQSAKRSVYLCGESFGGCLAMQVLTFAPELFDRVILINPASSFRRLPWMQLGPFLTRRLPNLAYRYSSLGMIPFLIEPSRVAKPNRKALEAAMDKVPAATAAWRMELLSRFNVERLPLERMTHPVLLIVGGNDRLLPSNREGKSLVQRFPNAKLIRLPKSGHACLLETETNLQQILNQHQFLPD